MSYCSNCIHYKVCGNEGVDDSAMTFCADKQTEKTAELRIVGKTTLHYECSKCGGAGDKWDNYCKHCGARMKKESEEE